MVRIMSGQSRFCCSLSGRSELLDDVLSASMIADSVMLVTSRALDVSAVVARAIGALPGITPTIAIEASLPTNLHPIVADREKLMQILTNLLTNAVKYSPDGGEIRISAAAVNGRLRLSVIDHGLGIDRTISLVSSSDSIASMRVRIPNPWHRPRTLHLTRSRRASGRHPVGRKPRAGHGLSVSSRTASRASSRKSLRQRLGVPYSPLAHLGSKLSVRGSSA